MGLDFHALSFLDFACRRQRLGRVATLGRQTIQLSPASLDRILGARGLTIPFGAFCEDLLCGPFGAEAVHSFDNSGFEGATFVHDFNRPFGPGHESWIGQYDTVMDGGTLEHIFDVPQALRNIAALCRPGGQILHVLPANNFNGHGFWQFSPELFHTLYTEANGYAETSILIAKLRDHRFWYEPAFVPGNRLEFVSMSREYVLVRTVKAGAHVRHDGIQQSDYLHMWRDAERTEDGAQPGDYGIRRHSIARRVLLSLKGTVERVAAVGEAARGLKTFVDLCTRGTGRHFRRRRIAAFLQPARTDREAIRS